jgi:hypothetical protein
MHHPRNKAFLARFALSPVALVAASLLQPVATHAQAPADTSPRLKPSEALREAIPQAERSKLPTFVGDACRGGPTSGRSWKAMRVRRGDTIIRARRLEYNQTPTRRGPATCTSTRPAASSGPAGNRVDAFPASSTSRAIASCATTPTARPTRIDFVDDQRAIIRNASYTPAAPARSQLDAGLNPARLSIQPGQEEKQVQPAAHASFRASHLRCRP